MENHPYTTEPANSMGKCSIFQLFIPSFLDHKFLLLHLEDTFQFYNELVKGQSTSEAESDIFEEYLDGEK